MKKGFYMGQPLIIKDTEEKATFIHDDGDTNLPCHVIKKDGRFSRRYYEYEQLEPATEFKFSEIIAGLEQGYFEVGTVFRMTNTYKTIKVKRCDSGLYLEGYSESIFLESKDINSTWQLVEPRKEMTLEEIEAKLGYKIKLK